MIEIEHKFLLKNDDWMATASDGVRYRQGYITTMNGTTVRIRIAGEKSYITLKGAPVGDAGIMCSEFEYQIPLVEAESMIEELVDTPIIDKLRYLVVHRGKTWEVDVFSGRNEGLAVAEIELSSEDEKFELPDWVGVCVSGEFRYTNLSLAKLPFSDW